MISILAGQNIFSQHQIIELNSGWQFSQAGMNEWKPATVPGTVHTDLLNNKLISDPFYRTNEKDLQWIDKVNWEYKVSFDVPSDLLKKKSIYLIFKGLDTYANIFLNNSPILSTDNMFREWKVDIKPYLQQKGNILKIYFTSPITKGLAAQEKLGYRLPAVNDQSENGGLGPNQVSIFSRKAPYSFGWDWGPRFVTSGIWKPVIIEAYDEAIINDANIIQLSINSKKAILKAQVEINSNIEGLRNILIINQNKVLAQQSVNLKNGLQVVEIDFTINNPKLWWPNGLGKPDLYAFDIKLSDNNKEVDSKSVTTGLRTVEVVQEPDPDGKGKSFYFKINGIKVFAKGANYIPNDAFVTRVTPADYEKIIKSAADAHMNMLRLWGGGIYEYDIFYELCDKYGIMVWHDFMFACSMYPGGEDFFENIRQEAIDNVKRLRNHPCIVLWCGNNEIETAWAEGHENMGWGWKQRYSPQQRKELWSNYQKIFSDILPAVVKQYGNGIFYWPSSPTAGDDIATYESRSGDMHYWGVWHGLHPFDDFNKYLGRFMSEYGFQSFPEFKTVQKYALPEDYDITSPVMAAHQRSSIGNLRIKQYMADWYREPKDFPTFLYVSQILQAEGIKHAIYAHRRNMPYVMGSLYWQINDCWPVASWSSIDYYKRWKALHYYVTKAFQESIVIPYLTSDSLKIYVASDRQKPHQATLQLNLVDFKGQVKWKTQVPVKILPNQGILAYSEEIKKVLNTYEPENYMLVVDLIADKQVKSTDNLYFVRPMKLNLQKPTIKTTINKIGTNSYEIKLTTDYLAKNVFLSLPNTDGFFSDNYFDLIPGRDLTIQLTEVPENIDVEKELQIITLIDSFNQ